MRGARSETSVQVRGHVSGDDFSFVRAMVLAGAVVGILPRINSLADESSGALVRVLADLHVRGATLYIVYPSRENIPARVTAFRDFVIDAFERASRLP